MRSTSNHSQQGLLREEVLDLLRKSLSHRRMPKIRAFSAQREIGSHTAKGVGYHGRSQRTGTVDI